MTEQPSPESASPALAVGTAVAVAQIYGEAETAILLTIKAGAAVALRTADPQAGLLTRTAPTHATVRRIVDRTEARARRAVPAALAEAYGRGHGTQRRTVETAARTVLERLSILRYGITRWVTQTWNRLLSAVHGPDPRAAADRVLQRDAGRGITVLDPAGRRRNVVAYAEATVQHAAGGAAIDGFADRLTERGDDLVIVTESPHPCPTCLPWEHRVLSVSGGDSEHPSMAQARADGLFHPNCHHTVFAWYVGFAWPPHSLTHKTGTYAATQRQRVIERHIREWKRRQAAALDDATRMAASRKVRAWQAELRRHLAASGLTRSRQRERTDYGHTSPLKHAHG